MGSHEECVTRSLRKGRSAALGPAEKPAELLGNETRRLKSEARDEVGLALGNGLFDLVNYCHLVRG